jgi:hypothetical protein
MANLAKAPMAMPAAGQGGKAPPPVVAGTSEMKARIKERIWTTLSRLNDKDTYKVAMDELKRTVQARAAWHTGTALCISTHVSLAKRCKQCIPAGHRC